MDKENASLVVIGTELTRGIIQEKHGMPISKSLTDLGYHMNEIVVLPDDGSIERVLRPLIKNNDIVIVTGGLGPTTDDMTRNAIATVSGHPLYRDEGCYERLKLRVGDRLNGANERQAYIPETFTPMLNPNGTAEGFYGYAGDALMVCLPGPPREAGPMFRSFVLPLLSAEEGHHGKERDEYTTYLIPEAKLEDLTQRVDPALEWGTRFQDYRISLYVSGGTKEERDGAIKSLRKLVGHGLVVDGDRDAVSDLTSYLKENKLTLSCAESCTGGMASMLLTNESGSSEYFMGSVVSYDTSEKEKILGVSHSTLMSYGAVSEECALEMAKGALGRMGSDAAFSVTGVAGPSESEGKAVGTVCFGFAAKGKEPVSVKICMKSWGRDSVRRRSCTIAFILMRIYLEGVSVLDTVKEWEYI